MISWHQNNWFSWNSKLIFPNLENASNGSKVLSTSELNLNYWGYIGSPESQYTFLLKHNMLGNLEGNGWITPTAIVQRYLVLNIVSVAKGLKPFISKTKILTCFVVV